MNYKYADELRFKVKSISEYLRKLPREVKRSNRHIDFPTFTETPMSFGLVETRYSAPIDQKNTGWHDEHIYEIGWKGRYHVTEIYVDSVWNWILKPCEGFNSGNGGGGHYEFRLYLKDFPLIEKKYFSLLDNELESIYDLITSPNKEDNILAENFLTDLRIKKKIGNITKLIEYQGNMPIDKHIFMNIMRTNKEYEARYRENTRAYML